MNYLTLFSAVYLIVACISPVLGYYSYQLYPKGVLNRIFCGINIAFSFWAFGFAVVIIAPNEDAARLWTRVSALGYSTVYAMIVHFMIALTGQSCKKWVYPFIYLPAVICTYIFSVSGYVTNHYYNFKQTASGWVYSNDFMAVENFFRIYYISYMLISVILLFVWFFRDKDRSSRKQAILLIVSVLVATVVGSLTDTFSNGIWGVSLPKMGPVLLLIPVTGIFYSIYKYHLLKSPERDQSELILNDERRDFVFRFAAVALIIGSVTSYMMEAFLWDMMNKALMAGSSAVMLILGIILWNAQRAERGVQYFEWIMIIATSVILPAITAGASSYGSTVFWSVPFIMILCSMVFNSNSLFMAAAVTMVLGQVYLIGISPQTVNMIGNREYISRLVMAAFLILIAYNIHLTYIRRLVENSERAMYQKLVSEILSGLSFIEKETMQERAKEILEKLADYYNADIAIFYPESDIYKGIIGTQFYSRNNLDDAQKKFASAVTLWHEACLSSGGGERFFENIMPRVHRKKAKRGYMDFFIPIYKKGSPEAFVYIETSRNGKVMSKSKIESIPVISHILSGALEKTDSELQIKHLAYYDRLTGLPNRQLFQDRTEQALHLARRSGTCIGVCFLDLDSFKSINDTMGHESGDLLICEVGQKLSELLRKIDTVARFGGDEFLIMINHVDDAENITKVADKIMEVFRQPFLIHGQEFFVTASMGISVFPADGEDVQSLIKHADIAMYSAKEKGKNQYAFCSENMKEAVRYRMELSNSLYRALERNEFKVFYQPQVDLKTERVTGMEALLRWFHPVHGMIPPSEFIPLAEQTGLIHSIGAWVLETACAQAVEWKTDGLGEIRIAVNLSVVQLRNKSLVRQIRDIFKKTGILPEQVEFEITESATTQDPEYILRILNDLRSVGVSISIDDFGTEYSSLSRLKQLPVDRLKMDIQFVRGIEKSEKDKAIAAIIIDLARNLDLKLVAEGVETNIQLDFLKKQSCDEVQGYYYYRPMPEESAREVLKKQSENY